MRPALLNIRSTGAELAGTVKISSAIVFKIELEFIQYKIGLSFTIVGEFK